MVEVSRGIADQIQLFPGIVEILDSLQRQGANLSIWTGRDDHSTQKIMAKEKIKSTELLHQWILKNLKNKFRN